VLSNCTIDAEVFALLIVSHSTCSSEGTKQENGGSTGLEPAASGVTGRSDQPPRVGSGATAGREGTPLSEVSRDHEAGSSDHLTAAFRGRTVYPSQIPLDQHHFSHLGPYELLSPLGAGGMGSVYRARDRRLNRDVALKILPEAAQKDPDRQRRFLQEAQAASALNHPNILIVYDVGADNGVSYIAAELIDGQSLRGALQQGPLPLRTLLDYAAQIADGLAAAHDAGIVHRDLKPENVMLTGNGRAKIVDFGLAKAAVALRGHADQAATMTAEGVILGTVPYMSPEQARGSSVDYRSDQFSFGVMLYEMATARQPFRRDSPVQTLSAIISEEPQSLSDLNPKLPLMLRWIVERCLAKDVGQRYASTTDLANDLRTIRDRLAEISTGTAAALLPDRRLSKSHVVGTVVIVTSAVVAAAGWLINAPPTGANLAAYRFTPLATDAGYQGSPAWSPDGKAIAYVAEIDGVVQVFSRSLSSSLRAQITHSRFHCRDPFWSPDGTHIYYISLARDRDGLWSASSTGGTSDLVLENVTYAAISPKGDRLAVFRNTSNGGMSSATLWTSSPPGAEPRRYAAPPFNSGVYVDSMPQFSPDGSKLGIWAMAWAQPPKFWIVPTSGGAPYIALKSLDDLRASSPPFAWLADSRRIVAAIRRGEVLRTHLWVADTEADSSQPVTMTNGDENTPAVSPDGERLVFASQTADWDLVEVPLDGTPPRSLLVTSRNEGSLTWSPTNPEFAFVTDRSGHPEIWLRNRDGQWERPVVTDRDFPDGPTQLLSAPAFSPDGQRVAYQRSSRSGFRIWISTLAGGPAVQISRDTSFQDAPTWSPDGAWIAYVQAVTQGVWTLVRVRVGGGEAPVPVSRDIDAYAHPVWSPNGKWIACNTRQGLSLFSPDAPNHRVLSEAEWFVHEWAADSSRLYAVRASDDRRQLVLASIDAQTGREQILNANLGPLPLANAPIGSLSRVSDKTFATAVLHIRSDLWVLDGFLAKRGLFERLRSWR
jgi:eukaryotic-like serine/threonine-protein kinase